jgi:CBS domain-containing protein
MFGDRKVKDAMSERPRAVTPQTTAVEAAQAMATEDVGALPLVGADGTISGIVTDRDLVVRVLARGLDLHTTPIAEIATAEVVTVGLDDDLEAAADLMARYQVRRLVVTGEDGVVVGMLSQADIALATSDKHTGHLVEDISEPNRVGPRV